MIDRINKTYEKHEKGGKSKYFNVDEDERSRESRLQVLRRELALRACQERQDQSECDKAHQGNVQIGTIQVTIGRLIVLDDGFTGTSTYNNHVTLSICVCGSTASPCSCFEGEQQDLV